MNKKVDIQGSGKDQVIQSNEIPMTYGQIQTLIQTTAWQDKDFKSKILKDPKSALESRFGIKFDKNINVCVSDRGERGTVYFNIPPNPAELTAQDLSAAAGGFGLSDIGSIINIGANAGSMLLGGLAQTGLGGSTGSTILGTAGTLTQLGGAATSTVIGMIDKLI